MDQATEAANGESGGAGAPRGLNPRTRVPALIRPPGSKSLAIRALLCAGLAKGETRLAAAPAGEDVDACLDVLRASGIAVRAGSGGELCITGRSVAAGEPWVSTGPVPCGESGTLARLTTAIYGFCADAEHAHPIEVRGSLRSRSSDALFGALQEAGVGFERDHPGEAWPVHVQPANPPETVMLQNPASSQELSGLLLALAAHDCGPRGRSVLVMGGLPSSPYAAMTASMLQAFGVQVQATGAEWSVRGPLVAPAQTLTIETDASGAAVALAAGCLRDQEVRVPGFNERSLQGDVAILDCLSAFGCEVQRDPDALIARGFPTRAADLDLSATPDLAPVIAAVAGALALRGGQQAQTTHLTGLETLNGKESRRVEVLAGGLRQLGIDVQETESSLTIGASRGLRPGAETRCLLDPHGDHRMAFAFGLLGLVRENLWVTRPECVAKSWPAFWEDLNAESLPTA